jgi:hypothetical protein
LRELFPNSQIDILLHGINHVIEDFCKKNNYNVRYIFKDIYHGLDCYDEYDLHVGYRVHGHVSALVRRKPSYLLVSDGRGVDYALTLNKNICVYHFLIENYSYFVKLQRFTDHIKKSIRSPLNDRSVLCPVDIIVSMINQDLLREFDKFLGLEYQIEFFSNNIIENIKKISSKI